jgi:pimeloyl-ACP methyl ester carboxylesterase
LRYYPIILVRGFDPVGGSNRDPFNGFNDATAYVDAVTSTRDFVGFVISFLNDGHEEHRYTDTVNVLRFHEPQETLHPEFGFQQEGFDFGDCCFSKADPDALQRLKDLPPEKRSKTFWVFNYYAAFQGNVWRRRGYKTIPYFARELQRFIAIVKALTKDPSRPEEQRVNLVAHSMGGVIVRHLLQRRYGNSAVARQHINRIVSLGSPLTGISYLDYSLVDALRSGLLPGGSSELDAMDPDKMRNPLENASSEANTDALRTAGKNSLRSDYGLADPIVAPAERDRSIYSINHKQQEFWNPERWLCVIGTREEGYAQNLGKLGSTLRGRSDGLVSQENAWLQESPRAYLHKIHGGVDSLITSRDSFEVVSRYLLGTHWVRVYARKDSYLKNFDKDSQYFIGMSVKVRGVDFFLNYMDKDSRNCIDLYRPAWNRPNKGYVNEATPQPLTGFRNEENWVAPADNTRPFNQSDSEAYFQKDLLLYQGALDMARSRINGQMSFRLDLNLLSEDEPSTTDWLWMLSMRQSDQSPLREQFALIYQGAADSEVPGKEVDPNGPERDKLYFFRDAKQLLTRARELKPSGLNGAPEVDEIQMFSKEVLTQMTDDEIPLERTSTGWVAELGLEIRNAVIKLRIEVEQLT